MNGAISIGLRCARAWRWAWWFARTALVACAIFTPAAIAQQNAGGGDNGGINRPGGSQRVVAHFGFEPDPNNPTDRPLGWIRAQHDPQIPRERPGFPLWNLARTSDERAHAGERALELPTRGGNTSLLMEPGVIPIFPGADYAVAAAVRTEGLKHASARLEATLLDEAGNPIEGGTFSSEAVRTERWARVVVMLRGGPPEAAYLQIECLLEQPDAGEGRGQAAPMPGGEGLPERFRIREQDYSGSAWFDEITVIQTPRVTITTDRAANLFDSDEPPAFDVFVRDLAGQPLDIEVTVQDTRGRTVGTAGHESPGGRFERRVTPELPGFGWYRAVVRVSAGGEVIGADSIDLGWLPPRNPALMPMPGVGDGRTGGSNDRARFGAILSELDTANADGIETAATRLGVGHLVLPALDQTVTQENVRAHAQSMLPLIDGLRRRGVGVSLSIGPLPDGLAVAADVPPTDAEGWADAPPETWEPWMNPLLDVLGQRVRRWQLGSVADPPAALRQRSPAIDRIEGVFARLVPGPSLRPVRWGSAPIDPALAAAPRGVTVVVPPGIGDNGLRGLVNEWRALAERAAPARSTQEPQVLSVALRHGERPGEPLHRQLERLARRAVVVWAGLMDGRTPRTSRPGSRIAVLDPFRLGDAAQTEGMMATPAGVVWRSLLDRLADRRHAATLDLGPGVRAEAFSGIDERRGALLVLWREAPADDDGTVRARLGIEEVEIFDLLGNRSTLEPRPYGRSGALQHEIEVGRAPVFIEGVDIELLRFQSSVRLDPPELLAKGGELQHDLVIENPWSRAVGGRYFLVAPGGVEGGRTGSGWRINPRFGDLTLPPAGEHRIPLSITVSPAVQTGPQRFVLEVDLSGQTDYGLIRVERQTQLGLPNIRLDVAHRVAPGGDAMLLEARITNTGDDAVGFDLIARVPGFARERRTISGIGPGETVTRVFPFRLSEREARGDEALQAHVAVVLLDGTGRLRRSVRIEP